MLVYLIAGEPSGDMLGARLMRALKKADENISFAGIGGENMEKEGLKSLFNISDLAIMGLVEVIPSIPKVLRHIKETVDDIVKLKPDVVITVDSWSFSARVHKALRKTELKVLQMHYVAPQVWAWKKGRAKTMYKYIDHLLTLFPNEPAYFTPHHLTADFVGHPAVESSMLTANPNDFLQKYNVLPQQKVVLLLPGSRHNEVQRLLPDFLDTAQTLQQKYKNLFFVVPTVKTVETRVRQIVADKKADVLILNQSEDRHSAMQAACVAIAASGTVALELAMINVPHLIAYKVPALTAWLVRRLTDIKYVNLTNILLNKLIVPELLQENCTKENLLKTTEDLLNPKSELYKVEHEYFEKLRRLLGVGSANPSMKAAKIIINKIKEYQKK